MTDETLRRMPLALLAERLRECTPEEQAAVLREAGWQVSPFLSAGAYIAFLTKVATP